ncbi:MAG: LytTR family transcriptional regulator [Lachnospiraceae bacterium]|nr:LytTR family transcriptional regulator [Lachnospiraceae bacterium]
MKIRVEVEPDLKDTEVVIRCNEVNETVIQLQNLINQAEKEKKRIVFYKDDTEFFIPLSNVLFFETSGEQVWAHTADEEFLVKYKLYELENMLPDMFMRVSKSTILNTAKIYSILRNLTAASKIEFYKSKKTVFVSRFYYKELKNKLSLEMER